MKLIINPTFVTNPVPSVVPKTKLARPYLYRREGVYYVRFRETGSAIKTSSVSLKTTQRKAAMDVTRRLSETLKAFHLDNPDASWQELREHLLWVAEGLLSTAHDVHSLSLWGDLYEDVGTNLSEIAATHRLSLIQHEHLANSKQVMIATQARLQGDSVPLVNLIKNLEGPLNGSQGVAETHGATVTPKALKGPALTFGVLSEMYLRERGAEQKPTTLSTTKFTHGVLSELLGTLDLRAHTRADLVGLRDALVTTRKPSTVNQMLMKLSAVLNWAVENGHLEKSYDKKLKFTKGLESTRKAFSQVQVGKLVAYSNTLPETSWKRWLLSLGAITGGRLNEISQLTVEDVVTFEDTRITAIHINEVGEGKSIKNKRSKRLVPLTDGAYGFDLAAFLRYVESCRLSGADALAQIAYRPAGEWSNQTAIPEALGDSYERGLVFHSFRHSLASLMQERGVPTTHAQAVMGHATGTITFDVYGSGVPVEVLAELLKGIFATDLGYENYG